MVCIDAWLLHQVNLGWLEPFSFAPANRLPPTKLAEYPCGMGTALGHLISSPSFLLHHSICTCRHRQLRGCN